MRCASSILGFLVACALTACSAKGPLDQSRPVVRAFELLDKRPPHGTIRADEVFAEEAIDAQFDVVDEDGQVVGQVSVAKSKTKQHQSAFLRAEGDARTEYLRFDDRGNLVATAVIDHEENAISHFDPPLLVMPAELSTGAPQSAEATMRVVDAKDPRKVRESGRAKRVVTYAGDQRVRTLHGEFDAKRIESRFTADLKLADVDELTVMFVVPGRGIVAEQSSETVKVLGAFGSTTKRTLVRSTP